MVINLDPQIDPVREQIRRHYARQREFAAEQQGGLMDDVWYEEGQVGEGPWDDFRESVKRRYHRLPAIVRSGLSAAGRLGLSGVRGIAGDFSQGMNLKDAVKKRLSGATSFLRTMMGGRRRKGARKRTPGINKKLLRKLKLLSSSPKRRRRRRATVAKKKKRTATRRKTVRRKKTTCGRRRKTQSGRKSTVCKSRRRKTQQYGRGSWLDEY